MGVEISGPGPAACAVLVVVVDGAELFLHAALELTKSELIHSAPEEDISVTVVVTVTVAPFQGDGSVIAGEPPPQLLTVVVMTEGMGKGGKSPEGTGKGGAPPEGIGKGGAPPEGSGKGGNPSPEDMGKGKGNEGREEDCMG